MKIIELNTEEHSLIWSDFLKENGVQSAFYTPEFFEAQGKHFSVFAYGLIRNSSLLALIVGAIQKNYFWPLSSITRRAIISGEPIVKDNNPEYLNLLLSGYLKMIKSKSVFTQIRNYSLSPREFETSYRSNGFYYVPHLNIHITSDDGLQSFENMISKNKRRNITKAINKGVTFHEAGTDKEFFEALALIKSTYQRVKVPFPSVSYFHSLYKKLFDEGMLKVFIARYDNTIIGSRIELLFGKTIFDWYAGSDSNQSNKYPNDFLIWNCLKWGKENGYEVFDFGGAGSPNKKYGVRDHKLKFGGELFESGRNEIIHKPLLYNIGKFGLQLYKRIK